MCELVQPLVLAAWLFFFDRLRLPKLIWGFLLLNLAGFATWVLFPAAPPWYVEQYGLGPVVLDAPSSAAGLLRLDDVLGLSLVHDYYAQSVNVFGAMPSVHVAVPTLIACVMAGMGWRWYLPALVFLGLMAFGAVYFQHHYVIDVLAGLSYGLASYGVVIGWAAVRARRQTAPLPVEATPELRLAALAERLEPQQRPQPARRGVKTATTWHRQFFAPPVHYPHCQRQILERISTHGCALLFAVCFSRCWTIGSAAPRLGCRGHDVHRRRDGRPPRTGSPGGQLVADAGPVAGSRPDRLGPDDLRRLAAGRAGRHAVRRLGHSRRECPGGRAAEQSDRRSAGRQTGRRAGAHQADAGRLLAGLRPPAGRQPVQEHHRQAGPDGSPAAGHPVVQGARALRSRGAALDRLDRGLPQAERGTLEHGGVRAGDGPQRSGNLPLDALRLGRPAGRSAPTPTGPPTCRSTPRP